MLSTLHHDYCSTLARYLSKKLSSGFTLTELLVAIFIGSILLSGAGVGLLTILEANAESERETQRRVDLNRALEFIAEDIKMANQASVIKPSWAWDSLNGTSPVAKLHLKIPLTIKGINTTTNELNAPEHSLSNGNAIRFGENNLPSELVTDTTYYISGATDNNFKVATSIANAQAGSVINFTENSSGSISANQLLIYYVRNSQGTAWLRPQTINRAAGPCSPPYSVSNCPTLVDAIKEFTATVEIDKPRQVNLELTAHRDYNQQPTKIYTVSSTVFLRSQ